MILGNISEFYLSNADLCCTKNGRYLYIVLMSYISDIKFSHCKKKKDWKRKKKTREKIARKGISKKDKEKKRLKGMMSHNICLR